MGETRLLNNLAMKRLNDRSYREADGFRRVMLPDDQEAVRLSPREWARLCADYSDALAPARRLMRWSALITIPASLMMLSVMSVSPTLKAFVRWIETFPYGNYVTVMTLLAGPVFALLAVHWRISNRATRAMEARLATHERVAPPESRRPILIQTYEIVAMVLIGPGIVIRAVGTPFPNLWRNTPFSGSHLGPFDAVAIGAALIVAAYRLRQWRFRQRAASPAAPSGS